MLSDIWSYPAGCPQEGVNLPIMRHWSKQGSNEDFTHIQPFIHSFGAPCSGSKSFQQQRERSRIKFPPYVNFFTCIVYSNLISDNAAGMKQSYENLFFAPHCSNEIQHGGRSSGQHTHRENIVDYRVFNFTHVRPGSILVQIVPPTSSPLHLRGIHHCPPTYMIHKTHWTCHTEKSPSVVAFSLNTICSIMNCVGQTALRNGVLTAFRKNLKGEDWVSNWMFPSLIKWCYSKSSAYYISWLGWHDE